MSDSKPQNEPSMEEILTTVRRIIAEDEAGTSPSAEPAETASSDILELTEMLETDGSVRHISPFGLALRAPEKDAAEPLTDGRIEPALPNPTLAAERSAEEGRLSSAVRIEDLGKSEPVVSPAMAAAPAALSAAAAVGPALANGGAVEAAMREMVRPMLQRWIDEHLPGMVEPVVRAEVARITSETAAQRRATRSKPKAKAEEG